MQQLNLRVRLSVINKNFNIEKKEEKKEEGNAAAGGAAGAGGQAAAEEEEDTRCKVILGKNFIESIKNLKKTQERKSSR